MNCEGKTRFPGFISSLKEPTAVAAKICVQPASFSARILERKFTPVGMIVWSLPWRARSTTSVPSTRPHTKDEEGSPYLLRTDLSTGPSNIPGLPSPEPPITAIFFIKSKNPEDSEGQGFEPWNPFGLHAFQACRFGRSRTSPNSFFLKKFLKQSRRLKFQDLKSTRLNS